MIVHLIDGTYELFRQHFGQVRRHADPSPVAATVGVVSSVLQLLADGATHVGVASDHVIESVRNEWWPTYKTSEGMDEALLVQIPLLELALEQAGVAVWAMVEWEADDALASAAAVADADGRVTQVRILTPDKDLGQAVRGTRVIQVGLKGELRDEDGVRAKFGVEPASIPDWLALVGDSADGFPGLPGWGAKSAASVLATYRHLEAIPADASDWSVPGLRGAPQLAATLQERWDEALLFRRLATLAADLEVGTVDDWEWTGPEPGFAEVAERLGAPGLATRAEQLAGSRRLR